LVYEVNDAESSVYVIAVGKRERGSVYAKTKERKQAIGSVSCMALLTWAIHESP